MIAKNVSSGLKLGHESSNNFIMMRTHRASFPIILKKSQSPDRLKDGKLFSPEL